MSEGGTCGLGNPTVIEFSLVCGFTKVGAFSVIAHLHQCRVCAEKAVAFFEGTKPHRLDQQDLLEAAMTHFVTAP